MLKDPQKKRSFEKSWTSNHGFFSMVNKKSNYQFGYHLSYFTKLEEAFSRIGIMSRTIRPLTEDSLFTLFDALLVRRPESAWTTDIQADGKFDLRNLLCL